MNRTLLPGLLALPLCATVQMGTVTYYRDVLPILQNHCLCCHRPGQLAPMSFVSYRQTRPWAEAIRQVVLTAKMPPWAGAAASERSHTLSPREAELLVVWVEQGAVAGNPKHAPPPAFGEEATVAYRRSRPEGPLL